MIYGLLFVGMQSIYPPDASIIPYFLYSLVLSDYHMYYSKKIKLHQYPQALF